VILAVDVGNTHTVLGLIDGDDIFGHWRVATDAALTADELRVKIDGLLSLEGHELGEVDRVVIASVVPTLTLAWEELSERSTGRRPMTVGPGLRTGLPIRYDNPAEVGADRIVNAVAAIDRFGAPLIIVDFGTATTIDVVASDGAYIGGVIAPGVETSAGALFDRAARLSAVDLEPPEHVIGSNTRAAVQSGLLFGEAAMVDGLVDRVRGELGADAPVVATGGLAGKMAPLCRSIEHVDEDLTLRGLALLYARNR
jgi:type III pantothenate kinase